MAHEPLSESMLLTDLSVFIKNSTPSLVFLVMDENTAALWQKKMEALLSSFPLSICLLKSGEEGKTIQGVTTCWEKLIEAEADRKSLMVAVGGGALCDTAAFAAACYMRGIPIVHVPTTLLAMVDACIGGKAAINFAGWRNMIGAFHPPIGVVIDTLFLSTLPKRELTSGIAEIIKIAYIADPSFFKELETRDIPLSEMIERAVDLKRKVVEEDPKDQGKRALLNWGHTFGHAIEALTRYKTYLHGEAVSIGMLAASALSITLGYLDPATYDRLEKVLKKYHLPVTFPPLDDEALLLAMQKDKKTTHHHLSFILSKGVGDVFKKDEVKDEEIKKGLQWIRDKQFS